MQLFEEMEEKDAHLFAVANTRRLALTGLNWRVVSASDVVEDVDHVAAEEAASYCRQVLSCIDSFEDTLQHLSLAIGRNIALAELVWDIVDGELQLVDLEPLDFVRITFDELDRPRILTPEEPENGVEPTPGKFVVHTPHTRSGHAQRGGLLRVTAMVYLAKNMALKDWMIFAEVFGMPVRIARYDPSATPEEKRELVRMLETLGTTAAGIFSRAVDLQVIEANRGTTGPPYEALVNFLNRETSKAWLGQTLTTETVGVSGTFAASRVQSLVREDIRTDDIRKEGMTIRRDILVPMTRFRFGADVPVPYFHRKPNRSKDVDRLTNMLDSAVNRLGIKVPLQWVHETLEIPVPANGEETLSGVEA